MYTKEDIIEQLKAMNAPQSVPVIVHSSFKAVGDIEGGPRAFLDTLIEYFTKDGGLLCIPTHTWHKMGKDGYTLDLTKNESCTGILSLVAMEHPCGVRTENPTHSMVVFGNAERVHDFIKNEPFVTTPTPPEGCYGKLYSEGGYVLLIGVAQNKNTYLHSVGEMQKLPNRMAKKPDKVSVLRKDGKAFEREITIYFTDYTEDISLRFVKYETAFRYHRAITDGYLGNAPCQLCDAVKLYDTVELIYINSGGNDPLANEEHIPQKLYCNK